MTIRGFGSVGTKSEYVTVDLTLWRNANPPQD